MSNPVGRPEGGYKINDIELVQMRRTMSRPKCAQHFGVTLEAIKAAEERIKRGMERAPAIASKDNIDSMAQLRNINESIMSQLKRCEKLILREDKRIEEFDKLTAELEASPDNKEVKKKLEEVSGNPTRSIQVMNAIVNVSSEARKHIQLQLEIAEKLYNLQMMAEFQNEVVQIIKEVDSLTAQKLIARIKERKAIRGLMKPI